MARSKAAKNCVILPWLTANSSGDGRFLQIGQSLFFSPAFRALGAGTQMLYFCMAVEAAGKRDFKFPLQAAKKYGLNNTSFRRYVNELMKAGFITVESGRTVRSPNNYSFSLEWKNTAR